MPKAASQNVSFPLKLTLTPDAATAVLATAAVRTKAKARVIAEVIERWAAGVSADTLARFEELLRLNGRDHRRENPRRRPRGRPSTPPPKRRR